MGSAGFLACRRPNSNSTWFPVSTTEWMPSDSIAELPVMAAATNLVTAISALPARAARMTGFDEAAMSDSPKDDRGPGRSL